eukprot:Amastigsp_a762_29.p5 type:complete len:111 gc:universal Amastigsp_a762_29:103-435(+)
MTGLSRVSIVISLPAFAPSSRVSSQRVLVGLSSSLFYRRHRKIRNCCSTLAPTESLTPRLGSLDRPRAVEVALDLVLGRPSIFQVSGGLWPLGLATGRACARHRGDSMPV